ncbi:hypothetical protein [Limnohabitans sp.]|uniref:hypothetical protein n=1 Tax=Limnohabitans sp. TaxID=1907725 RepID=UPI00286ECC5B|nr:hypothetical protein [Limnohabitans sp.]
MLHFVLESADFENFKIEAIQTNDVDAVSSDLWQIASECCESRAYAKAIQEIKDSRFDIVHWLFKYVYSHHTKMLPLFDSEVKAQFTGITPGRWL